MLIIMMTKILFMKMSLKQELLIMTMSLGDIVTVVT